MLTIYIVLSILILLSLVVQFWFFDGISYNFLSSLMPNFTITLVGIFISVFVIDKLLEKDRIKKSKDTIINALDNQYQEFVMKLSLDLLTFVLKHSPQFDINSPIGSLNEVTTKIINNSEEYIKSDFFKKDYTISIPNSNNYFKPISHQMNYQDYCEIFKSNMNNQISEFLNRYISILPEDIKISILIISNQLKSGLLQTGKQFGIVIDMTNAEFDLEKYTKVIKKIAIELDKLQKLCIEIENK